MFQNILCMVNTYSYPNLSTSGVGTPGQERRTLKDTSNSEKPPAAPSANEEGRSNTAHSKPAGSAKARAPLSKAEASPLPEGYKRGNAGTVYKVVESGCFEIADHTLERLRQARVPQELIVFVKLPANAVRFHCFIVFDCRI